MGQPEKPINDDELEWIKIRQDINDIYEESTAQKFVRKFKENPLVPIGTFATVLCLTFGLVNMAKRNSQKQQFYMRGRVLAQGFTVMAFVLGIGASFVQKKT